jgi:alkylation response protein AidB-like acyl-CoA dehydrogenase
MELILSDEQQLLHDSAGKFFERLGGVKRVRQWRGGEIGYDRDCLRKIGDNGWLAMLLPEEQGGAKLGPRELALVLHQAGRVLAPEPMGEVALAALMISAGDDPALRGRLIGPLIAGESVIVPALQDLSGTIESANPGVTAVHQGGEWRLSGSKGFVVGAGACDGFLVNAQDADGTVICHVPRSAPGLNVKLVPTVDGRPYGELTFRDVATSEVVAKANSSSAILERHRNLALLAAAAEMLGVMEAANDLTLDYLKTRKQFGRPIGSFQALQHRAVDNYVLIEGTRSLLHQVCEGGEPVSASMASAVKAVASSAALTVTKSAVQLHGAIGFTDEYDAGLYLKRAMWLSSYLGNETVHRQRYARLS